MGWGGGGGGSVRPGDRGPPHRPSADSLGPVSGVQLYPRIPGQPSRPLGFGRPTWAVVVPLAGETEAWALWHTGQEGAGKCPDRAPDPDAITVSRWTGENWAPCRAPPNRLQLELPLSPAPHGDPDLGARRQLRKLLAGASIWTGCDARRPPGHVPATARTCRALPGATVEKPPCALASTGLPPGPHTQQYLSLTRHCSQGLQEFTIVMAGRSPQRRHETQLKMTVPQLSVHKS